jgi:hypothetical protein
LEGRWKKMKFKYQIGDGFTMIYSGIIGVLSAVLMLIIGVGFDVVVFGVFAYSVLMFVSMASFFMAYVVKHREVTELTAEETEKRGRKDYIFDVEDYYYRLNKEVG